MALTKAEKRDSYRQIMAGIQQHFGKAKTVTLQGKAVNLTTFTRLLQASIDAGANTDAQRTVFLEASKASQAADAAVEPTLLVLKDYLVSTQSPEVLSDFGIRVKQRAVPDVETKAQAIKKGQATRKARGTLGPKAKKKVVGVVSDAPAAPASTPSVAAAATNGAAKPAASTTTN